MNAPQAQLRRYVDYIRDNSAYTLSSLSHGIILVLPAGTTVHNDVKEYCGSRNIPLFQSEIYYRDINPDNTEHEILVNFPECINFDLLRYHDLHFSWVPESWMKSAMEQHLKCTFSYEPTPINYEYWISKFEQSYLIPVQLPPDANEICEDTVDPQDCE